VRALLAVGSSTGVSCGCSGCEKTKKATNLLDSFDDLNDDDEKQSALAEAVALAANIKKESDRDSVFARIKEKRAGLQPSSGSSVGGGN
jgi:hypothetical protein